MTTGAFYMLALIGGRSQPQCCVHNPALRSPGGVPHFVQSDGALMAAVSTEVHARQNKSISSRRAAARCISWRERYPRSRRPIGTIVGVASFERRAVDRRIVAAYRGSFRIFRMQRSP